MMTNPCPQPKKPDYPCWIVQDLPPSPKLGDHWWSYLEGRLYVWDGVGWWAVISPYSVSAAHIYPTLSWDDAAVISGNVDDKTDCEELMLAGVKLGLDKYSIRVEAESHGKEIVQLLQGIAASLRVISMRGVHIRNFGPDALEELRNV